MRHALDIRHITVREGALDLEVAVALEQLRIDERVARRVLSVLPNLERHVCVNGKGARFGDELVGTELPHVLEHVAIELQARAAPHAPAGARAPRFIGHTSWLAPLEQTAPERLALMRVTISFLCDFVALRACSLARVVVEWALGESQCAPDPDTLVAELRAMMEQA